MSIYAFTGHRPKDLPVGYGMKKVETALDLYLATSSEPRLFVTGGALGIDTYAAQYAINHDIPLWLILPFNPGVMTRFWNPADNEILLRHIKLAQHMRIIEKGDYNPGAYQRRNEAMILMADQLLAFWSGKRNGGTWNAIQYAERIGTPIVNLLKGVPA